MEILFATMLEIWAGNDIFQNHLTNYFNICFQSFSKLIVLIFILYQFLQFFVMLSLLSCRFFHYSGIKFKLVLRLSSEELN